MERAIERVTMNGKHDYSQYGIKVIVRAVALAIFFVLVVPIIEIVLMPFIIFYYKVIKRS